MRLPARRKAFLAGAVSSVVLLAAGVAFREELVFHYHAWRLERAQTVEAARPWLGRLEGHVQDPLVARRLVEMLGPRRPRLTYWVFQWPFVLAREQRTKVLFPRCGGLLHLARSLEHRLRRDEAFLALGGHFLLWRGSWAVASMLRPVKFLELFLRPPAIFPEPEFLETLHSELVQLYNPAEQEALMRLLESQLLVESWLLGMSPLPAPAEMRFPISLEDLELLNRRWEELWKWRRARTATLRFDRTLGRLVEGPAVQVTADMMPKVPLPGWTGPVPEALPAR